MPAPAEDAYWFVAGNTTQVWSSARVAYVPPTDAAYQAWLAAGRTTIPVISEDELSAMLNSIGLPHLAPIPSAAAVDMERDRRIALGQELFLKSGKVISLATATPTDFRNIDYASGTALTLIARTIPGLIGDIANEITPEPKAPTPGMMTFRDFHRKPREVTYHEMAELSIRVTDNVHAINEAAHLLKDMAVIPRDYKNDSYWPLIPLPPNTPPP